MKQLLLIFLILSIATSLSAQATIWEEDFSEGMHGWTSRTTSCGEYSGPEYGVWELTSGTIDDAAVDFGDGLFSWSFLSPLEYSISFRDATNPSDATSYGSVYARYEMNEDTLVSDISSTVFIDSGDGNAFIAEETNGIVRWATNMELNGESTTYFSRLIGTGNPVITFTNGGQNFTYNSQDGFVTLEFTKTADCGSIWNWSPNGNVGYDILGQNEGLTISSDTRQNGVIVANNLFQSAQGDTGYNPGNPPYPQYVAELISPPIDISGANGALFFEMSELVAFLNVATGGPTGIRTSFAISNDDGATWSNNYDINEGLNTNTVRNQNVSIPILINDVDGADEIRIKLTWGTDFYYWAVDDMAIRERIPYEMQANANFYAIASNAMTPASQVEPMYFMADIQNNGGAIAENVNLNLTIVDVSIPGNPVLVLETNNTYGDITPDSLAENSFFEESLATELQTQGVYRGTYTLTHDSLDSNPNNDVLEFDFIVTDTLFAKETGRTRGIFLPNDNAWYIGNSFYVPNGEGLFARYISFMVDNASDVVDGNGVVTTYLYESDGDLNDDGRIDGEELGVNGGAIAFNDYQFDGTEDRELITIPIDLDGFIPLKNDKYYLAVIQYVGQNDDDKLAISASEDYNYGANSFITDSLGMPRYSDIVDLTDSDPSYFRNGFGGTVVPIVRLSIGIDTDVKDLLSDDYKMLVFPNPAKDEFQLKLDMPEQLDVYVRLYDQNGRIIFVENYEKLDHGVFTYDVSDLASGVYMLKLSTAAGIRTEKVIVAH